MKAGHLICLVSILVFLRLFQFIGNEKSYHKILGEEILVSGQIDTIKEYDSHYLLTLKARNVFYDKERLPNKNHKFLLKLKKNLPFNEGDQIRLRGRLAAIKGPDNPGQFNKKNYYRSKKIFYELREVNLTSIEKTKKGFSINLIKKSLRKRVFSLLPYKESGILLGLLLGDKDYLDMQIRQDFSKLGLSHILALSGMHVGLLVCLIYGLLKFFPFGYRWEYGIILLILVAYYLLTGRHISTARAIIMCLYMQTAIIIRRPGDIRRSFFLALAILLLVNPYYIYDVSFSLSFSAVFSIIFIYIPLKDQYNIKNKLLNGIAITLIIQITSLPIISLYFYKLPLLAFLLNIIIVPLVVYFMLIGFFGLAFSYINIWLGRFIMGSAYYTIRQVETITGLIGRLENIQLAIRQMQFIEILVYYLILLAFLKFKKKYILFFLLTYIIVFVPYQANPKISMLYVGQAESIVIEYKRKAIVIDAGGEGNRATSDYLMSRGRNKIDLLIISHTDNDHIGGIERIAKDIEIKKLLLPMSYKKDIDAISRGAGKVDEKLKKLVDIMTREKIDFLEAGDKIGLKNLDLLTLYPFKDSKKMSDNNENSLILKMTYHDTSILFTGDAGFEVEEELIKRKLIGEADILKVGHHGSKNSTSDVFLKRVNPRLAIISCGRYNKFGHPSKDLIDRLKKRNIDYKVTRDMGAIVFRLKKDKVIVD